MEIIQLTKKDGTPFYPATGVHQPLVLNGVYWVWNPDLGLYVPTSIQVSGEGHNLFPLSSSPTKIIHNFHTKPSVTVMGLVNGDLHEVIADVIYIDNTSVQVSWNGDIAQYVYII